MSNSILRRSISLAPPYGQPNRSGLQGEHRLVFLEDPDKGAVITYRHGTAETELPLFVNDGEYEMKDDMDEVTGSSSPSVNKAYVVWLPELKMLFGEPIRISSSESSGDVTKLNFEHGCNYGETSCRIILRKDLDTTCNDDLRGQMNASLPRVIGKDAIWIPVETQDAYEHGMPKTEANVSYSSFQPPADFQPVTLSNIDKALSNSKKASIAIERSRSGM
ncbi:MAG: hypothetical protein ABIT37_19780 [Luteolibacter sp.]